MEDIRKYKFVEAKIIASFFWKDYVNFTKIKKYHIKIQKTFFYKLNNAICIYNEKNVGKIIIIKTA